jgi:AcrR family transcriptional regulator
MPHDRATGRGPNSTNTQRDRLLAGMLAAVNDRGYAGATVANVIARAGVSRRAFYEYFSDKDDCFLALYRDLSVRLVDQLVDAISHSRPERALHAVVQRLTEHAEAKPAQAQFLASNALAAGPIALEERRRTIDQISGLVQAAHAAASPQTPLPDVPARTVVGATQGLIAQRICRGERDLAQLAQDLEDWLTDYELPIENHRWSSLASLAEPRMSPGISELLDVPPRSTISDRLTLLLGKQAEGRCWRILCATAESALQSGYAASTVTSISARAQLHKPFFYDHFADKRQAFLALHDLAFQQTIAVGAAAYFSAKRWPERVWRCLLATSLLYAAYPALAHVGFVETQALGLPAIQRAEESRQAFATLLRADSPNQETAPPATVADAVGAAIFELIHDRVREQRAEELPRYAYHACYLALAPFLGVQAANDFVRQKLDDSGTRRASKC